MSKKTKPVDWSVYKNAVLGRIVMEDYSEDDQFLINKLIDTWGGPLGVDMDKFIREKDIITEELARYSYSRLTDKQ